MSGHRQALWELELGLGLGLVLALEQGKGRLGQQEEIKKKKKNEQKPLNPVTWTISVFLIPGTTGPRSRKMADEATLCLQATPYSQHRITARKDREAGARHWNLGLTLTAGNHTKDTTQRIRHRMDQ